MLIYRKNERGEIKKVVLLSASLVLLIGAVVLLILHFTAGIGAYWASLSASVSAIINLLVSISNLKEKRKNKDKGNGNDGNVRKEIS